MLPEPFLWRAELPAGQDTAGPGALGRQASESSGGGEQGALLDLWRGWVRVCRAQGPSRCQEARAACRRVLGARSCAVGTWVFLGAFLSSQSAPRVRQAQAKSHGGLLKKIKLRFWRPSSASLPRPGWSWGLVSRQGLVLKDSSLVRGPSLLVPAGAAAGVQRAHIP